VWLANIHLLVFFFGRNVVFELPFWKYTDYFRNTRA